jgi:steroid 5-alpha reductase family enzyme
MMPGAAWISAMPWLLLLGLVAWAVSTLRRNAGLVDIFWSGFVLLAALYWFCVLDPQTTRAQLVLGLTALWALRLALHLARRNWNAPEDHRYRAIRARNEPGFVWKSLYLVFGLQALLAFLVAAPLYAGIAATTPSSLSALDIAGALLVLTGIVTEGVADWQLSRFLAEPTNRGKVMDRGLWRYSRHPNYFGEFCVWWGFFLIALAVGSWGSIVSPLLMSVLLLRVSGVTLLEQDIGQRRPGYADYAARTNAFFPGPRRSTS